MSNKSLPPPPPTAPPLLRAKSHQTGFITSHWNDLPANFVPSSNNSSRSSSRNANTRDRLPSRQPSPLIHPDLSNPLNSSIRLNGTDNNNNGRTSSSTSSSVDLKPLAILLPALYNLPTALTKSEHSQLQNRLNKSLIDASGSKAINETQDLYLRELLTGLVLTGDLLPMNAKEDLVGFMKREQGVAVWASALRRVIENVLVSSDGGR